MAQTSIHFTTVIDLGPNGFTVLVQETRMLSQAINRAMPQSMAFNRKQLIFYLAV